MDILWIDDELNSEAGFELENVRNEITDILSCKEINVEWYDFNNSSDALATIDKNEHNYSFAIVDLKFLKPNPNKQNQDQDQDQDQYLPLDWLFDKLDEKHILKSH